MIRVSRQNRYHVSNRLAIFAALILAITSFIGLSSSSEVDRQNLLDGPTAVVQQSSEQGSADEASTSKRKLSISLLLFRNG